MSNSANSNNNNNNAHSSNTVSNRIKHSVFKSSASKSSKSTSNGQTQETAMHILNKNNNNNQVDQIDHASFSAHTTTATIQGSTNGKQSSKQQAPVSNSHQIANQPHHHHITSNSLKSSVKRLFSPSSNSNKHAAVNSQTNQSNMPQQVTSFPSGVDSNNIQSNSTPMLSTKKHQNSMRQALPLTTVTNQMSMINGSGEYHAPMLNASVASTLSNNTNTNASQLHHTFNTSQAASKSIHNKSFEKSLEKSEILSISTSSATSTLSNSTTGANLTGTTTNSNSSYSFNQNNTNTSTGNNLVKSASIKAKDSNETVTLFALLLAYFKRIILKRTLKKKLNFH